MNSTLECVTDWILRQRWYAGKGRLPDLRQHSVEDWPSVDDDARIRVLLVMDHAGHAPTLYHVPIVVRSTIPRGSGPTLIGRNNDGEYLFDAPHDPAYAAALLARIAPGHPESTASTVFAGEQSNTSIRFDFVHEPAVICKVFRMLHNGENPDVTLQGALSRAGSTSVPRFVGSLAGEWDDVGEPSGRAVGHLAFAQEFLPGVVDGWQLALDRAMACDDFGALSFDLGSATAGVHATLLDVLPVVEPGLGDIVAMVAAWHRRLAIATSEVPMLAPLRSRIEAVYDEAQAGDWPHLQRIHGDLHLGQALLTTGGRWVLVDFEGEPMRPMRERMRPDVILRDIAGMLRSFDYAAGTAQAAGVDKARADAWTRASRAAYLAGYEHIAGAGSTTGNPALLGALELDKAVYESIYEARNRPDWLAIPLRGIERLLAAHGTQHV